MPVEFLLIPGRTANQGTTLNEGKYTDGYIAETHTLKMAPQDMRSMSLADGDRVRMWNQVGAVEVPVEAAKGDELPSGMLFISYGNISSQLMGGETHGSGMPDSKCFEVWVEKAESQAT